MKTKSETGERRCLFFPGRFVFDSFDTFSASSDLVCFVNIFYALYVVIV